MGRRARSARSRLRAVLASSLLASFTLVLAACAGLARQTVRSYAVAPSGLLTGEQRLRDALAAGRWGDALTRVASAEQGGPDDALLRDLYAGATAYYAERWDESAAALERAASLADDRFTKRVSRGALALVANDFALPYAPGENERLFVHYYGILGRLRRGDPDGAAVEARRLSFLLAQYDADGRDAGDASTRAALRYLAGAAFEAAGEREDAAVAYRNAGVLLGTVTPAARAADSGDVVVVVEQGFVAHRVAESLSIDVGSDRAWGGLAEAGGAADGVQAVVAAAGALLGGDRGVWADSLPRDLRLDDLGANGSGMSAPADVLTALAARVGRGPFVAAGATAGNVRRHEGGGGERPTRSRQTLRVAWPAYRRAPLAARPGSVAALRDPAGPALAAFAALRQPVGAPLGGVAGARLGAATLSAAPLLATADVSDAVVADFKRDRAKRLARLLVRAAARAAAADQAGQKYRELGDLVRHVSRAVERADTRSWHLLPGRVAIARLRLPAGIHSLAVEAGGVAVALPPTTVTAGGVALATTRLY